MSNGHLRQVRTGLEKSQAAYFDELAREGIWEDFSDDEFPAVSVLMENWNIQPGEVVLEPGCGPGRLTQRLAEQVGSCGQVIACDISGEMVRRARQRSYPASVRIDQCALTDLHPGDHTFDRIICFNVFPHFESPLYILRHIHQLLKVQGVLWVCHSKGREEINAIHAEGGAEIQGHQLPPAPKLAELMIKAGFQVCSQRDAEDIYWVEAEKATH